MVYVRVLLRMCRQGPGQGAVLFSHLRKEWYRPSIQTEYKEIMGRLWELYIVVGVDLFIFAFWIIIPSKAVLFLWELISPLTKTNLKCWLSIFVLVTGY